MPSLAGAADCGCVHTGAGRPQTAPLGTSSQGTGDPPIRDDNDMWHAIRQSATHVTLTLQRSTIPLAREINTTHSLEKKRSDLIVQMILSFSHAVVH